MFKWIFTALGVEDERPEYDMDDEDLEWLTNFNKDKASQDRW
jgi:hypothetical protein